MKQYLSLTIKAFFEVDSETPLTGVNSIGISTDIFNETILPTETFVLRDNADNIMPEAKLAFITQDFRFEDARKLAIGNGCEEEDFEDNWEETKKQFLLDPGDMG